jgi:EAL domain-containing protein (putative c-di-GMP-specific phosphodiesterase class I)
MRRSTDIVVVQSLHEALAADRFALFVQPILPLNGDRTDPRFEFLLRMVSENSELLPPEKFLSAAERYQLLPAIDRWVIRNAIAVALDPCRLAAQPRDALLHQHLGRVDRLR